MVADFTTGAAASSQGGSQTLAFSSSDIKGMALDANGHLVVSLKDGTKVTVGDLQDLASGHARLTLEDGHVLDTAALWDSLSGQARTVDVRSPANGETMEIDLRPGEKYALHFSGDVVSVTQQESGALLISFGENGTLVLKNFSAAMDFETPPDISYDGTYLSLSEFLDTLELAEAVYNKMESDAAHDAAQTEPAAGEIRKGGDQEMADLAMKLAEVAPAAGASGGAGGGHGAGFQSSFSYTPVDPLHDIGPIGPTSLAFGLPGFANEAAFFATQQASPPPKPDLTVSSSAQVYEDGSIALNIFADPDAGPQVAVTVTVSGIPAGWTVLENGGDYNPATGKWTISLPPGQAFSGGPTLMPPPDSDADIPSLQVSAQNFDGGTELSSSSSTAAISIVTDAVADAPHLTVQNTVVNEDKPAPLDIQTALADTDGSEEITAVYIKGVPEGFTLSDGVNQGGGTWLLQTSDLATLKITAPENFHGTIGLVVESVSEEVNKSGSDFDLTNDEAHAFAELSVTWRPVADTPSICVNNGTDDVHVKEDGTVDVPVQAALNPADSPDAILTVTVSGIDPSWNFSAPVGTYDAGAGTWTVTLAPGASLSTLMTFAPPADSDVDLTGLTAVATAYEPATVTYATSSDAFNVVVDAVADKPTLDAANGSVNEGTAIPVALNAALTDTDGSEAITSYRISGVPSGFVFNHGTNLGGGIWSFTPAQIVGLTLTPPSAGYHGTVNLTAAALNTENPPTDTEYDFTDNNNNATDPFALTWRPVCDPPSITVNNGADDVQVKEDGSVQVHVVAAHGPGASAAETLTVVVTGINPAWGFSAPVGTYDSGAGTWTVNVAAGQNLDTYMTFTPPADSDVDLTGLTATVTAYEPATATSATASDGFGIIVDAVADAPTLNAANNTGNENQQLDVNLSAALTDTDGSEVVSGYKISGVPSGFSFNQGTDLGGGVWSFTPAEIVGLKAIAPANYAGTVNLTAQVLTTENPVSDGEYDASDNNSSATDGFCLTWRPVCDPPSITVNNGADNVQVKEDGSVQVHVVAAHGPGASAAETLTVVVTGINPAWGFTAPVGTYDSGAGTWTVNVAAGQNLDTYMTFTPPANSDVDLTGLTATVTAYEPATATSATASDGFGIIVDAVADAPTLNAANASGDEGTAIPVVLSAALTDTDGSEVVSGYKISGVPAGFSFNQGTDLGGGVWSFTPAQIAGLTISAASPSFAGTLNLTATVYTTENPVSDGEYDTSDNNAQASDGLCITFLDNDQPVFALPETITADETNLGPVVINDSISADFGDDGPGTFSGNGTYFIGTLTSGGHPVTVSFSGNTYTGTANGNAVFTLHINADGTYTYTQTGALDHPDSADPNDALQLQFGVTATDTDGDTANAVITVNVLDDGVTAHDDVNEFEVSAGSATGNVITGVNGGAGAADDQSNDQPNTVTKVTFNGVDYNVPAGGFVTVNGNDGVLKMYSDGHYVYTPNGGGLTSSSTTEINHFGETLVFPTSGLSDGSAISGSELNNLGIKTDALKTDAPASGTVTFVSEGAGYNNTLGMYTIAADGTLMAAKILIENGNAAHTGDSVNFTAGAGENIAFFIIANGSSANGGYAGIDLDNGTLQFVYKYGTPGERPAKADDDGSFVKLVFTDNTTHAQTVLNGPLYHTTERSGSDNLNADDSVRILSGLAEGGNDTVLRIGFEDLPCLGDKDYEDIIFDVSFSETFTVSCAADTHDVFEYTLTDGDGDSSAATLTLNGDAPDASVSLQVNGGADNVQVKEDHSVFVPVAIQVTNGSSAAVAVLTLTGVNPAWGFSGTGWVSTGVPGEYKLTLAPGVPAYNGGFTLTPPANSDIDLNDLNVSVAVSSGDGQECGCASGTATSSDGFNVIVDAVADAPVLNAGNASGLELTTIPLTISAHVTDTDGSEAIKLVRISDVPPGMTLTAGTQVAPGVWEVAPANLAGLGIQVPNGSEGTYTLQVKAISTENPVSDGEYDTGDNEASASTCITLCVGDNARPELGGATESVDETTLGPIVEHGSVAANFGTDGPGTVAGTGVFGAGGSLTGGVLSHNGVAIAVSYDAGTGIYTGKAGGLTVFTLEVNPSGTYTFQQFENLDHANGANPNDVIQLSFGIKATDIDGDVATNAIVINVADDAPVAHDDVNDAGSGDHVSGNVITGLNGGLGAGDDVGQDDPGRVTQVTFNGAVYNIPAGGSVTIDGASGTLVMHSDGSYEYTVDACDPVPPANTPPDAVDDCFTVYELDASSMSASQDGTVIFEGSGHFYYPVFWGWSGSNADTYTLTNGVTVAQDTNSDVLGFWYRLPVLQNDTDADGDSLTITSVRYAAGDVGNKEFVVSPDGKSILVRIGQDGDTWGSEFKLEYTVNDGHGGMDTAIATVKVLDYNSPLVLDLDGDGIELLPLENGVLFDMGPNGALDHTGWVAPDDGLLAIDLNHDGIINDHSELFGTGSTDGFTVLSALDSNGDHVMNAADSSWGSLVVWRDANSDGVSQAGELFTMNALGIASINLNASGASYLIEGSLITHESTFTYTNGTTGAIVDAWFESYQADDSVSSVPASGSSGTQVLDQFTYTIVDSDGDSSSATLTLTGEPHTAPHVDLTVNGGAGDVHVKEDGSVFVPVTAHIANGSSATVTVLTLTGVNPAWGFSGTGWTATATPGEYKLTLAAGAADYSGGFTLAPPANSDIDLTGLTLTVSASGGETSCGCGTGTESSGFNVIVDAVADAPVLNAADTAGNKGQQLNVNLGAALTDTDGSEVITGYKISGVPSGFSFNHGSNLGGGVWSFTPAEIVGLKAIAPANYVGTVNLTAKVLTTENPVSDGEYDTSDNNNSATDGFCLTWRPVCSPPSVTVNNGADNVQVKEDGSVQVHIVAAHGAGASAAETLTVVVSGIKPGWGFTAPVGTYNAAAGTWTVNVAAGQNLDTLMKFTPPANSDIDLNGLTAKVTAYEPSTETSATATDSFKIIVDAVADAPHVALSFGTVVPGQPVNVNLSGSLTDTDGSEVISSYKISGVPAGFSFNHGTNLGGGVWSFAPADLSGLKMTPAPSYSGTLSLTATVYTTENPVRDGEYDMSDNNANASVCVSLPIVCAPDNHPPVAVDDHYTVYEGDLFGFSQLGSGVTCLTYNPLVGSGSLSEIKLFAGASWYKLSVLNNDSDPDGDSLHITSVSYVSGLLYSDGNMGNEACRKFMVSDDGKSIIVGIAMDGNWDTDYLTLSYTISDGHGGTDTALVCLTIPDYVSPLVLDLDRDGVELLSIDRGVLFDMGPDGVLEKTGWVGADDGLLALDKNMDGVINDHGELFGTDTIDGFTVLSGYDSNGDGAITADDQVWSSLLVWKDGNTDGVSQEGELYTLNDLGISGINLGASTAGYMLEGNVVSHESTFAYADGTTGEIVDAWFQTESINTVQGTDGADTLAGTQGADLLQGGGGDDVLSGGAGNDMIYGGAGADTFLFQAISDGADRIMDFDAAEGDKLDLSVLVQQAGYDSLQDSIDNFVFATDNGSETVISVDASGSGDAANATVVAILEGVGDVDLNDLLNNGNLAV